MRVLIVAQVCVLTPASSITMIRLALQSTVNILRSAILGSNKAGNWQNDEQLATLAGKKWFTGTDAKGVGCDPFDDSNPCTDATDCTPDPLCVTNDGTNTEVQDFFKKIQESVTLTDV